MFPIFIRVPYLHASAMTLWFIVLYKGGISERTKRHETIHLRQYNELLVLGFWLVYLWDFLVAFALVDHTFWGAYRRIRLEQEAYAFDSDEEYLETRRHYAWWDFSIRP